VPAPGARGLGPVRLGLAGPGRVRLTGAVVAGRVCASADHRAGDPTGHQQRNSGSHRQRQHPARAAPLGPAETPVAQLLAQLVAEGLEVVLRDAQPGMVAEPLA